MKNKCAISSCDNEGTHPVTPGGYQSGSDPKLNYPEDRLCDKHFESHLKKLKK